MEYVKCNLCGVENTKIVHRVNVTDSTLHFYLYARNIPNKEVMTGRFTIVKCKNCGLVYTNPRCTTEELDLLYSSNEHLGGNWRHWPYLFDLSQLDDLQQPKGYNGKSLDSVAAGLKWQVNLVEKYRENCLGTSISTTRLLNVGCGYGAFLKAATYFGYDAYGCDLVEDRVNIAKNHYKLKNVEEGTPEKLFSEKKFHIITLWDVIEHVQDPKGLLTSIHKMLKPKGLIFIYTMSLDSWTYRIFRKHWYYIDPIGHLYYFSDRTIQRLMEEVGFTFLGKEFDNSKSVKLPYILREFTLGIQNHIVFYAYRTDGLWQKAVRKLLEMVYSPIPEKRIKKRMENLSPYLLPVRYKDDFIYVGQKNG